MHTWQLQEAKAKFSSLIRLCDNEPQMISLRGEDKVVMLSIAEYSKLLRKQDDNIVSFFRNSPIYGMELNKERDKSLSRDIEL